MPVTPKDLAKRHKVGEKWVRQIAREETTGHPAHKRWLWQEDDPELARVVHRLENGRLTDGPGEWEVVVSRKNQLTLPAAALRRLGIRPGHRIRIVLKEGALDLIPSPASWADHYAGVAQGLYGKNDNGVEKYLRESRGDWEPLETDDSPPDPSRAQGR
jgi:bifunctional DNA-binding transcriptional regulator/antitoxin component of YhaV-PrlF toxin-antitoxin module